MIASVEGTVGAVAADSLVLEVGGIGYRVFAAPAVLERLLAQGMTDASMKPAEFAAAIRDETAVWAKIIKARNIVAE